MLLSVSPIILAWKMINCKTISAGQASSYYKIDDYYLERAAVPARVVGEAVEALGLSNEFSSEEFNAALAGKFENSELEKAGTSTSLKRAAFDIVASAPKSLTIAALVDKDQVAIDAHAIGVAAMVSAAQEMVRARVTADKSTEAVSAKCAIYQFDHTTARQVDGELPDPDLHTHCVMLASVVVKGADGVERIYKLSNEEFFKDGAQHYLDSAYKQASADHLRKNGKKLRLTKYGWELDNILQEEIDVLSKRKNSIDEKLEKKGTSRESSSGGQRQAAALDNRNSKREFARKEMHESWQQQIKEVRNANLTGDNNGRERSNTLPLLPRIDTRQIVRRQLANAADALSRILIASRTPAPAGNGLRILSSVNVVHHAKNAAMLLLQNAHDRLDNRGADPDHKLRRLGRRDPAISNRAIPLTADDAVNLAIKHYSTREVAVKSRYVLANFAISVGEFEINADEINKAIDRAVAKGRLIEGRGAALVFPQALDDERSITDSYTTSINTVKAAGTLEQSRAAIAKMEADITARLVEKKAAELGRDLYANEIEKLAVKLNDKQVATVDKIVTSTDRVNVINGDAGTGKSTAMEAAKNALEAAGFKVLGLGPSAQAVKSLEEAGLSTKTSQHAVQNARYWSKVDSKTVIILDEAGLLDVESLRIIQERAKEKGARISFTGDYKQYGSVNRGTALKHMAADAHAAGKLVNLDDMQRGRNEFMRDLHFQARDKPADALTTLFKNKMVTAVEDDQERLQVIAEAYQSMAPDDRKSGLVLTGTNADRIAINAAVRERMTLANDAISIKSIEVQDATREQAMMLANYEAGQAIRFNSSYKDWKAGTVLHVVQKTPDSLILRDADGKQTTLHPSVFESANISISDIEAIQIASGDRVRLTANNKDDGYINGDRGTVESTADGKIAIRLDRTGKLIQLATDGASLPIRYAYAQTGHSAQGATAKMAAGEGDKAIENKAANVILALNSGDATVDAKSFYTNITRAADKVRVITNAATAREIAKIKESISRVKDKDSARELVGEKINLTPEQLREQAKREQQAQAKQTAYLSPSQGADAWQSLDIDFTSKKTIIASLQQAREQYGQRLYLHANNKTSLTIAKLVGRHGIDIKFDDRQLNRIAADAAKEAAQVQAERDGTAQVTQAANQQQQPAQQPVSKTAATASLADAWHASSGAIKDRVGAKPPRKPAIQPKQPDQPEVQEVPEIQVIHLTEQDIDLVARAEKSAQGLQSGTASEQAVAVDAFRKQLEALNLLAHSKSVSEERRVALALEHERLTQLAPGVVKRAEKGVEK